MTEKQIKNYWNKNSKKAVSIMIGYVILIGIAIVIAGVTYVWLKTYVPSDPLECPDGTSLYIENINCSISSGNTTLNLILKNNGRFNVDGFIIRATNSTNQTVASIDLSSYLDSWKSPAENYILFPLTFSPRGYSKQPTFNIDRTDLKEIEIIPVRVQEEGNKLKFAACSQARVTETLNC